MARSTVRVAERRAPNAALHIVADLRLEIGDDRGTTAAHLWNEPDGLVLEVDQPAVLLRAVPGRGLARDLPVRLPREPFAGTSVRLRTHGHDLGLVTVSSRGRLRLRPTLKGLLVAGRTATSYGSGRRALLWVGPAAVAGLAATAILRRRSASGASGAGGALRD